MRQIKLNALIVFVLLTGAALLKVRASKSREPSSVDGEVVKRLAEVAEPAPLVSKVAILQKPATPMPGVVGQVETKSTPVEALPFPFEAELSTYTGLKRKVFLNPIEQRQKEEILRNRDVLRGMQSRLVHSPVDGQQALAQNAAIDLLLEALKSGDSEVATEVLRSVVTDGQVEDAKVDASTRENLAGIKGEVLFQWSALKPTQSDEMASLLPGPVSQKIWQNVISAQKSNLAESADLKD